jgi:hypothetical protein
MIAIAMGVFGTYSLLRAEVVLIKCLFGTQRWGSVA